MGGRARSGRTSYCQAFLHRLSRSNSLTRLRHDPDHAWRLPGRAHTSSPLITIRPPRAAAAPVIMERVVVSQLVGPTRPEREPARISRSTPAHASFQSSCAALRLEGLVHAAFPAVIYYNCDISF